MIEIVPNKNAFEISEYCLHFTRIFWKVFYFQNMSQFSWSLLKLFLKFPQNFSKFVQSFLQIFSKFPQNFHFLKFLHIFYENFLKISSDFFNVTWIFLTFFFFWYFLNISNWLFAYFSKFFVQYFSENVIIKFTREENVRNAKC